MTDFLSLQIELFPFFNISLYLNNIPFIINLCIKNIGNTDSGELKLKIIADQPCIEPFTYHITDIPFGMDIKIPLEGLKINRQYIAELSEAEKAVISFEVWKSQELIATDIQHIDIHPLEHFGGFQVLPELTAAYVTPNHPYVYHIKRKAIEVLERNGQKTAFEGYQSNDPERVLQILSAIYSALRSEEIIYSSLPPGYEATGQRLRLLNTIQREKFGNCIDLSLLFAACLEAADLNPIIIIIQGHAFVGCWLYDDKFSEIINDDKSAITKRLSKGIREIAAIEATSICKGSDLGFTDALNLAEAQLVEKDDFLLSIDVKRARTAHIRPLPIKTGSTHTQLDDDTIEQLETANMESQFEIGTIYTDELLQSKQPATKQKIWERKLLDLSLRNSLLNIRITRNMLQLVDINISQLEDTLSDGRSFSIMPNPRAEILRRYNLFSQPLHHSSPMYQTANDELKYNRLLTYYHHQDLDHILTYIHKNAKQSIEENGSSTLYLAVGLLKWYDRRTLDQPRYAPILLIPVELNRRSVNSKFTLKSREEETMINITLLEFLRQEYQLNLSALEHLPYDEKGVDVAKVMGTLRRAIMQLKGWDIEEQLILGNFSFSKLILWKDIVVHQEELLKSKMVRSLIENKLAFYDTEDNINAADFDHIPSQSILLPIPTDASQMEAVLTAQQGKSFILHGPPGTGKSQTITNIIADALYHGKRVLFVAAKKAALDVVYKRLEQIGLNPFSLELHSNKSKKSDVLEQLAKSLETAKAMNGVDFSLEAQRLDTAKKTIANYVDILHKKQPVGWSLYHSIAALEEYKSKNFPRNFIPAHVLQKLDATLWQQWTDWLPAFLSITGLIVHPQENPLAALTIHQYSIELQEQLSNQTKSLVQLLPEFQQKLQTLLSHIKFPYLLKTRTDQEYFINLVNTLKNLPNTPLSLIFYLADKENQTTYEEWNPYFSNYQNTYHSLLKDYNKNILSIDVSAIEIQWKQAEQSWFLPKWWNKRKIKKQLSLYKNTPIANDDEASYLFKTSRELIDLKHILQQQRFILLVRSLKNLYKEEQTNLNDIQFKATSIKQLNDLMDHYERNALGKWAQILEQGNIRYSDDLKNNNIRYIEDVISFAERTNEALKRYQDLGEININLTEDWPDTFLAQLQGILLHLPKLKDWAIYIQLCKKAKDLDLQWLIDAFERKQCNIENIADYFQYTTHSSLAQSTIAKHESLSLFNTGLFESKVELYKNIAQDFRKLTIHELRVKLSSQLPNTTIEAMQSSEIGILQRNIKNRGRGTSIRKLFDQIPTLLPRLAPCMLMSPISAAQYFDVNVNHFDLVIFDEASQLPTCEAVSALARAKQAIIVGDPKQMPPTSFFSTNKIDEDNMEVEDLESILDDCLSLSIPSKYLLRHYRSKHESLIAFSNVNYYDSKLLTFPSADDLNRKVKYHYVPGYYDKGKTRTNVAEANAIVDYIKQHYSTLQKNQLSLGVVTFSQTQQTLIEDKLQQLFSTNAALEQTATETAEPLFIKNLENVQGDERDIILFSIGYAPDETGKMTMNFGPLNRNGGWRRLNVAVTRARYEMHVFATLKADLIDLGRTSAEGVAGLKSFLQFAENGHLTMSLQNIQEIHKTKHLAEAIGRKLQKTGLTVKTHIGTSDYKIDIGIVHPDKPEQYILGIVVDGYYYYHAHTTNDREMVMPSVLKALGWNIHRIWSMDWYENADTIIHHIVEKVEHLKLQPKIIEEPLIIPETTGEEALHAIGETPVQQFTETKRREYIAHTFEPSMYANSETIYEFQNRNLIRNQLQMLVETEYPISKSLLYKKLLQAWNTSRVGAKLEQYLGGIVNEMEVHHTSHHQAFYWPLDNNPTELAHYRNNETEKRNIEDIAPEEIMIALEEVVQQNLSIEEEELLRYLARTFGFAKVGRQIDVLLRYAIDLAEQQGKVKRDGGRVGVVV